MSIESEVVDRLKAARPAKVVAILNDGTKQPIAVPDKGQKWSRTWAIVAQYPWTELLLLNAKNEALDRITQEGAAGDLENVTRPGAGEPDMVSVGGMAQVFSVLARDLVKNTVGGLAQLKNTHRAEMQDILEAHKDLAERAFTLLTETQKAHAKEAAAWQVEREEMLGTILELRAELAELNARMKHKSEPTAAERRDEQLLGMLTGNKALPTGETPLGGKVD